MRPTRTAFALSCALGAAILGALLGVAAPAAADPVPATCPHLTVDLGEFDFVPMLDDAPEVLLTADWDCGFVVPTDEGRWQFDKSGAGYEDFLSLVDAMFADPSWEFTGGRTGDAATSSETVEPGIDEWPRETPAGFESAVASFSQQGSDSAYQVTLDWQESMANGGGLSSASWRWGGNAAGDEFTHSVTRDPGVASYLILELSRFTFESVPPPAPIENTALESPSTVSELKTVLDAVPTPFQAIALTLTGALLTVFIGLPSALVSGVLSARWDRWFGWARRPTQAVRRVTDRAQRPWVFWVGIVVASLIAAFVDPKFGFNWMSLRLYLTLFGAFAVFNVGAWLVIARVLRRLEPELPKPELRLRIGSLLVLLLGVLVSRLLVLEPGIVFGIVAGLVFATTLVASRRASVVLVGAGFAAAAGVAAWILYSILTLALGGVESAFTVGVIEFFGGLTLQGLSALPIALLPFAVLDGGELFRWNRPLWVAVYLGATVLFLLVLVNVPNGTTAVPGDFLRWLGLYFAFAVVATAIWGVDRLVERRRTAPRLPESEAAR